MNYKRNIKCIEHITKSEEINSFAKIPIICSLLKEIREYSEKDITLNYNNLFQDLLQLKNSIEDEDIQELILVYANNIKLLIKEEGEDWDNLLKDSED